MSLIRDLADQIIQAHRSNDLCIPIPAFSINSPPPRIDNEAAADHYELAGALAAIEMGFIESDAKVLGKAWSRMTLHDGGFDPFKWPSRPEQFDLLPWTRNMNPNAFKECPKRLGLYGVMPDADWVKRMVDAEIPTVQLRFKSEDRYKIRRQIKESVKAVESSKTLLFINDYWEEAIDAEAYGVHLGQEDLETADLEKIRGAGLRLGLSTHGYSELVIADRFCPSYIAMGAIFPTNLKKMPTAPQGLGRLYQYAKLMSHYPLVAIGGIDQDSIHAVSKSGVGSVAVVRAITQAKDPKAAVKHLQELMQA
ncbi:thiamine-phosphate diphosphorylase [Polynucleobacter wuianus]|uniref:Thiamine-phosphate synthase n=1 Tax=Polynucleobacter wuianus TaxID=1743168 RepID=A0A191UF85_9BURK|nr:MULTISPECIES: thiamine phosphate synthase [Polynucleobacter]ANI99597.1 thiamine-phosphate diphosphorylase [Polynucleobacter wuianus]MBU3551763.1 thiamine phosphate synthase [Polynucleobacter sp. MWH-Post4-6-1]